MKTFPHCLLFLALTASGAALAQVPHAGHSSHADHSTPQKSAEKKAGANAQADHSTMNHSAHAGHDMTDHSKMNHSAHTGHNMTDHSAHAAPAEEDHSAHAVHDAPDHSKMDHSAHTGHAKPAASSDTPREPIPELTPADFEAAFPKIGHHAMEHASTFNSLVSFDHLERWDNAHGSGQSWAVNAWFGDDINRLWINTEGEHSEGSVSDWNVDALYGRAVSPWWDVVAGVNHENRDDGRHLTRAAVGVQGITPYKFEMSAMTYLGGTRKAELAVELEYDVLLTNRLILQPAMEAHVVASGDPNRGIGKGLGHVETGLRLRYEFTRRFAPYVGFVHKRLYGRTRELHREAGENVRDSRWVAGVRFWF